MLGSELVLCLPRIQSTQKLKPALIVLLYIPTAPLLCPPITLPKKAQGHWFLCLCWLDPSSPISPPTLTFLLLSHLHHPSSGPVFSLLLTGLVFIG